jgi:hypothetical protein
MFINEISIHECWFLIINKSINNVIISQYWLYVFFAWTQYLFHCLKNFEWFFTNFNLILLLKWFKLTRFIKVNVLMYDVNHLRSFESKQIVTKKPMMFLFKLIGMNFLSEIYLTSFVSWLFLETKSINCFHGKNIVNYYLLYIFGNFKT